MTTPCWMLQGWIAQKWTLLGALFWAREMGPAQDGPFLEYFHNRRIGLLEPDRSPPQLTPYASEGLR